MTKDGIISITVLRLMPNPIPRMTWNPYCFVSIPKLFLLSVVMRDRPISWRQAPVTSRYRNGTFALVDKIAANADATGVQRMRARRRAPASVADNPLTTWYRWGM